MCFGPEHKNLRSPNFKYQFQFWYDSKGQNFIRYTAETDLKMNKRGLKYRKMEPRQVDMCSIENVCCCFVRIILKPLAVFP